MNANEILIAAARRKIGTWVCESDVIKILMCVGLPLETLAALRDGTMKAVPAQPTAEMAAPLCRLWLLADQRVTEADTQHAKQYAAAVIAAAPAKPEDE